MTGNEPRSVEQRALALLDAHAIHDDGTDDGVRWWLLLLTLRRIDCELTPSRNLIERIRASARNVPDKLFDRLLRKSLSRPYAVRDPRALERLFAASQPDEFSAALAALPSALSPELFRLVGLLGLHHSSSTPDATRAWVPELANGIGALDLSPDAAVRVDGLLRAAVDHGWTSASHRLGLDPRIRTLMVDLSVSGTDGSHVLYDPQCGAGDLLCHAAQTLAGSDLRIVGSDTDRLSASVATARLLLQGHAVDIRPRGEQSILGEATIVVNDPGSARREPSQRPSGEPERIPGVEPPLPPSSHTDIRRLTAVIRSMRPAAAGGARAVVLISDDTGDGPQDERFALWHWLLEAGWVDALIGLPLRWTEPDQGVLLLVLDNRPRDTGPRFFEAPPLAAGWATSVRERLAATDNPHKQMKSITASTLVGLAERRSYTQRTRSPAHHGLVTEASLARVIDAAERPSTTVTVGTFLLPDTGEPTDDRAVWMKSVVERLAADAVQAGAEFEIGFQQPLGDPNVLRSALEQQMYHCLILVGPLAEEHPRDGASCDDLKAWAPLFEGSAPRMVIALGQSPNTELLQLLNAPSSPVEALLITAIRERETIEAQLRSLFAALGEGEPLVRAMAACSTPTASPGSTETIFELSELSPDAKALRLIEPLDVYVIGGHGHRVDGLIRALASRSQPLRSVHVSHLPPGSAIAAKTVANIRRARSYVVAAEAQHEWTFFEREELWRASEEADIKGRRLWVFDPSSDVSDNASRLRLPFGLAHREVLPANDVEAAAVIASARNAEPVTVSPSVARAQSDGVTSPDQQIRVRTLVGVDDQLWRYAEALTLEIRDQIEAVGASSEFVIEAPTNSIESLVDDLRSGKTSILNLIAHFSGGSMAAEDVWGNVKLGPPEFSGIMAGSELDLVMLVPEELARRLVIDGAVGAAIGFAGRVSLGCSLAFSTAFYRSIASGDTLNAAFVAGRAKAALRGGAEAMLTLHTRSSHLARVPLYTPPKFYLIGEKTGERAWAIEALEKVLSPHRVFHVDQVLLGEDEGQSMRSAARASSVLIALVEGGTLDGIHADFELALAQDEAERGRGRLLPIYLDNTPLHPELAERLGRIKAARLHGRRYQGDVQRLAEDLKRLVE